MDINAIHQVFLRAAIDCAEQGATAKEMAEYLAQAERGMRINAAFHPKQENLLSNLRLELERNPPR